MRVMTMFTMLTALVLAPGAATAASADDFQYANTKPDGSGLPYRYFVPPGYDADQAYPLILFLHGSGERGNDNEKQLNNQANGAMRLLDDANLARQPVFMIAPQCPGGGSWSGATLHAAITAIEQVAEQYHVDPGRIYVTGLSLGGIGTWSAVLAYPDLFAAAVPMSGNGNTSQAASVSRIPFWFFHAANDPTVNVSGSDNLVTALRKVGAHVVYTRYDGGGHAIWPKAYATPLLFDWLVAQRLGQRDESVPPGVHVEQPTQGSRLFTPDAAIVLSGSATNDGEAITQMRWSMVGGAEGDADGTTAWNTGSIALADGDNLIRVIATGPSYHAPYGGKTTFNDSLRVTRSDDLVFADGFDSD